MKSIKLLASLVGMLLCTTSYAEEVELTKVLNASANGAMVWTFDSAKLLTSSSWNQTDAPKLSIEGALKLAEPHVKDKRLSHISLQRPIRPFGSVFFYLVAFEDDEFVVVLLDGTVVPHRVERE